LEQTRRSLKRKKGLIVRHNDRPPFPFPPYFHSKGFFIVSRDEQDVGEKEKGEGFPHGESDMRPACFSNWKIRGVCVDECPHMEACMEESLARLPPAVRLLISRFEPLDSHVKFLAWERRAKKLKE
jgi:hypothetical protein